MLSLLMVVSSYSYANNTIEDILNQFNMSDFKAAHESITILQETGKLSESDKDTLKKQTGKLLQKLSLKYSSFLWNDSNSLRRRSIDSVVLQGMSLCFKSLVILSAGLTISAIWNTLTHPQYYYDTGEKIPTSKVFFQNCMPKFGLFAGFCTINNLIAYRLAIREKILWLSRIRFALADKK